jgi:hypothetical protein
MRMGEGARSSLPRSLENMEQLLDNSDKISKTKNTFNTGLIERMISLIYRIDFLFDKKSLFNWISIEKNRL